MNIQQFNILAFVATIALANVSALPDASANFADSVPFAVDTRNFADSAPFSVDTRALDTLIEFGSGTTTQSGVITLPIHLNGGGSEFAVSGSIQFDPAVFSSPQLALGSGAGTANLTQNLTYATLGRVGFLLGFPFGETFPPGTSEILQLQLTVNPQAPKGVYQIVLGDVPSLREVVNELAETTATTWTGGTVSVVNRDPVAVDDLVNTDEDTSLSINAPGVLANDYDPDSGDVLDVVPLFSTTPGGASISINPDGGFGYDPTASATLNALPLGGSFADEIEYTINDGDGGSDTATLTVNVAGVNDAPTAQDDSDSTNVDVVLNGSGLLENDTDLDTGDTLTVTASDTISDEGATVSVAPDGRFSYDASAVPEFIALAEGEEESDDFSYTVSDQHGGSDEAEVNVTVTGVNDAPFAEDDVAETLENTPLNISGVSSNDSDPDVGDSIEIVSVDAVSAKGATVTLNANGSIDYNPTAASDLLALADGVELVDTFDYVVEDNLGLQASAKVHVTVTGTEFESDVTPRPNGDNIVDVTDAVLIANFVVGVETPSGAEFARADTAPRTNAAGDLVGGNGQLAAADWVQSLRYAAGLDAVLRVLGPSAPPTFLGAERSARQQRKAKKAIKPRESRDGFDSRKATVSIDPSITSDGDVKLTINMVSTGHANAVGFSVSFDPETHRYKEHKWAAATKGTRAIVNTKQVEDGRIGFVIANSQVGQTFQDGTIRLLDLKLTTISEERLKNSRIRFGDFPAARAISDTRANRIDTEYVDASVKVAVDFRVAFDEWLRGHFGEIDFSGATREQTVWGLNADPDGDGQSNEMEFLAGTSPDDSSSTFKVRIDRDAESPEDLVIAFRPFLENRYYRLLYQPDLEDSSRLVPRAVRIHKGENGEGIITGIKRIEESGFFRIQVLLSGD